MAWPLKINWEGYATKPGVTERSVQRAISICEMHCPICLEMLCADAMQQCAVEIKCMCKQNMWHEKCFEDYARQNMPPIQDNAGPWTTIVCPLARHIIQVNRDKPARFSPLSHVSRRIPLAPLVKMVLESGGKESRNRLRTVHREIRKETRRETRHAKLTAARAPLWVRGEQNFLAALYGTLLPEVLIKYWVGSYSLWWYRAGTESMEMGYYGDDNIEPWRSPNDSTVNTPPHRVLSTKVQLRFKFDQGVRVDWDRFRAALRQNLGCRCSKPWKYKMATFRVVEGGGVKWTALEGAGQIHHKDTWVLTLDLHDTITRCKNSGAIDDAAVRRQIMLTRTNRGTRGTREDTREDTLGEPAQEADVHYVVSHAVYDNNDNNHDVYGDDDDDDDIDDDIDDANDWAGSPWQLDDFDQVARQVSDAVNPNIPARLRKLAVYALTDVVVEMSKGLQNYVLQTPLTKDVAINVSAVRGEESIYDEVWYKVDGDAPSDSLTAYLHRVLHALILAFDTGPGWAKIKIHRRNADVEDHIRVRDEREWIKCAQLVQASLTSGGCGGVVYRDSRAESREASARHRDLVVVKTCTPREQDQRFEILVFWWSPPMNAQLGYATLVTTPWWYRVVTIDDDHPLLAGVSEP